MSKIFDLSGNEPKMYDIAEEEEENVKCYYCGEEEGILWYPQDLNRIICQECLEKGVAEEDVKKLYESK